jgi:hypothetical protein
VKLDRKGEKRGMCMSLKRILCGFVMAFVSQNSLAAEATFGSSVERVLVDDSKFAGCMVQLSNDPQKFLPNCERFWVTLDCLNLFPESIDGISQNKLSQAQLALVSGRKVTVRATDRRIANGYCFAQRVDVR